MELPLDPPHPKKGSKKKKPAAIYHLWRGSWWILLFLGSVLFLFLESLLRDYAQYDLLWIYFVVGLGSLPFTLVFLIEPHNPFQGDSLQPRLTSYNLEERKVLAFLRKSPKIKSLVSWTGVFLFLLVFTVPLLKPFFYQGPTTKEFPLEEVFYLFVLYLFLSMLVQLFVTNRYLIDHWEEILAQEIEPWPLDKPYSKEYLKFLSYKPKKTFFSELAEASAQSFHWSDVLICVMGFVGLLLMVFGFNQDFKSRVIEFLFGALLLLGARWLWTIRHRSNQKNT